MFIFTLSLLLSFSYSKRICECHNEILHLNDPPNHLPSADLYFLNILSSKIYGQFAITNSLNRADFRFNAYLYIINLLSERNAKTLVETGTLRHSHVSCESDGCSTIIFGNYGRLANKTLISIDNDQDSIENAQRETSNSKEFIKIVNSDAVEYLENFKGLIDFLYLDSMDVDFNDKKQLSFYREKEIEAAYDKLHTKSVIAMNNCDIKEPCICQMVKEYLLYEGWTLAYSTIIQVYIYS